MRPCYLFAEPLPASEAGMWFLSILSDISDAFPDLLHQFYGLMTVHACCLLLSALNY